MALTAKRFNEAVTAAPSFARANTCFFCFYAVKTRTSPARDGCAAVAPSLVNNQARKGYAQKKSRCIAMFPELHVSLACCCHCKAQASCYLGYLGAFCYRLLLQGQTRASFAMATTSLVSQRRRVSLAGSSACMLLKSEIWWPLQQKGYALDSNSCLGWSSLLRLKQPASQPANKNDLFAFCKAKGFLLRNTRLSLMPFAWCSILDDSSNK